MYSPSTNFWNEIYIYIFWKQPIEIPVHVKLSWWIVKKVKKILSCFIIFHVYTAERSVTRTLFISNICFQRRSTQIVYFCVKSVYITCKLCLIQMYVLSDLYHQMSISQNVNEIYNPRQRSKYCIIL